MFQCSKHVTGVSVIIPVIINVFLVCIHGPQSSPALVIIRVGVIECLGLMISSRNNVRTTCAVQTTHS